MPLTKLEEWKLERYKKMYPDLASEPASSLLEIATDSDKTARSCGFDSAATKFHRDSWNIFQMALLVEKSEMENAK